MTRVVPQLSVTLAVCSHIELEAKIIVQGIKTIQNKVANLHVILLRKERPHCASGYGKRAAYRCQVAAELGVHASCVTRVQQQHPHSVCIPYQSWQHAGHRQID